MFHNKQFQNLSNCKSKEVLFIQISLQEELWDLLTCLAALAAKEAQAEFFSKLNRLDVDLP